MEYTLAHNTGRTLSEGKYYPLGATPSPAGVNFAIYSQNAREVFLLLFDRADGPPTDIIEWKTAPGHIWHVFVHGVGAGQLYGYKVRGEFDPAWGLRFNEHKLLIDPYAKALSSRLVNTGQPARGLRSGLAGPGPLAGQARQHAGRAEGRGDRRRLRLAGRRAARTSPSRSWSSTRCT